MESVFLHVPKPSSQPTELRALLSRWNNDRADELYASEGVLEASHAVTTMPQGGTAMLEDTPQSEASSLLNEYRGLKIVNQIKMIRSKLAFFRMLLPGAALNEEQRKALEEFASDLNLTIDAIFGSTVGTDATSAMDVSSGSLPGEDTTNIPILSVDAFKSVAPPPESPYSSSDLNVGTALAPSYATQFGGGHISSLSSASLPLPGNDNVQAFSGVSQGSSPSQPIQRISDEYNMPGVWNPTIFSSLDRTSVPIGPRPPPSHLYIQSTGLVPQASNADGIQTTSVQSVHDNSWHLGTTTDPWPIATQGCSSSSAQAAFNPTQSQVSPLDYDYEHELLMPGAFNNASAYRAPPDLGPTFASPGSLPVWDDRSTANMSMEGAAQLSPLVQSPVVPGWYEMRSYQLTTMTVTAASMRFQAFQGSDIDPSSPQSWSSNMSECSIVT